MTTIACNHEVMAGDLQFTELPNGFKFKGMSKVHKFRAHPLTYPHSNYIVGFAGSAGDIVLIAEFFNNPESFKRPPKPKGLTGLVLTENRDIFVFDEYSQWLPWNEPYAALGSGAAFALGALVAGKSPSQAIAIAAKHDAFTGMGIKTLKW